MIVTLSLMEILVLIITLTMVAGVVIAMRIMGQILRSAQQVEELALRLEPRAEEALSELTEELRALQVVTERAQGIGRDAEVISSTVARTAVPFIEDVEKLRQSKRYVVAATKGVRAGVRAWKDRQEKGETNNE